MQVQNASNYGSGSALELSNNVTWYYPFFPGEPPGVLRTEFAACVPSNVTLSSICCSAVGGQFVEQGLSDIRTLNESEVKSIYESRYPGQNISYPTSTLTGNLVNATDTGGEGAINWCTMAYNPMSDTALQGTGFSSGGQMMGNVPQSMQDWITCFENNTSAEARATNQVVYACSAIDVKTGGIIEGYNRTYAQQTMQNGAGRGIPSRWAGVLGVTFIAGLWSVCI